ncbi:ROK family protein [Dasania marina]|uniref:ROK family protein n=1 Tax=Dasania marina TaxID=471499 RepID=UPI0030DD10AD|tara:strand:+ start:66429 stop:67325 length:897 start_codon:yes stop_codon:yes gene_type:complete
MHIGIDLGGSKIEVAAFDSLHQKVFCQRVATPQGDYAATLNSIKALVAQAEAELQQTCTVGLGTPGSPSALTGAMKNCNSTCLNGQYLQADIEVLLGRPVRIANDANCFALSEAVDGAAVNAAVVFGVILGTGVGGGLVVKQQLLTGANHIAGEWGHNPLPAAAIKPELVGRVCYCGRRDCIETYLSGPGLTETFKRISSRQLAADQIVTLAEQGDQLAGQALADYQQQLAMALAQVINIVDPDVIVLGGGMSKTPSLYQQVPQLWGEYVFNDEVLTQLQPAHHGDASGVRGAARLWP